MRTMMRTMLVVRIVMAAMCGRARSRCSKAMLTWPIRARTKTHARLTLSEPGVA
jgi:hypothetical protein